MILLSIITVTFNNAEELKLTLDSIHSQDLQNFEVIVIDGGDNSKSKPVVESYAPLFENRQVPFRYLNQKDSGPYDGMNKGIDQAQGQWTTFMNSGDHYETYDALSLALREAKLKDYSIIAGSTCFTMDDGKTYIIKPGKMKSAYYTMPFCHQSLIIKTDVLKQNKFDTSLKIIADQAQIISLHQQGYEPYIVPSIISHFNYGGLSSNIEEILKEVRVVLEKSNVGSLQLFLFSIYSKWTRVKILLKKIPALKTTVRRIKYNKVD
jgi:glycosyltransferase involved in cell wall biosynthesis